MLSCFKKFSLRCIFVIVKINLFPYREKFLLKPLWITNLLFNIICQSLSADLVTKSKSLSHTVKDNLKACRKCKQVLEEQVHQVTLEKVGRTSFDGWKSIPRWHIRGAGVSGRRQTGIMRELMKMVPWAGELSGEEYEQEQVHNGTMSRNEILKMKMVTDMKSRTHGDSRAR